MQAQPQTAPSDPATAPHRAMPPGPDAFDSLFIREYPRVVAVARRVLGDVAEAEDVAQEVFWELHRRHPGGHPKAGGWLHSAAVHTALNRIRSRRRRERREIVHGLETQYAPDPERIFEASEDHRMVRAAMGRLPERKAAVLALRYAGLSYAEVAAALGVGIGQVGTLLRRAEALLLKEVTRATSA